MKVKVSVKTSPKTQEKYYGQVIAEAHAEMEAMFQENKDLRVSEGHLRDDLARAQVLIAELETELAELTADYDALVQTKREYGEYIDTLRQENKRLRNQMPLPEFMRQFIEMTREAVQNEFPDSGNS